MNNTCRKINIFPFIIGIASLLIGLLIYLIDRPPECTYFVFNNGTNINTNLYKVVPNIFGSFGYNLPAFLHVFAFILITGGLIPRNNKGYIIITIFWFTIDFAFEVGQKFKLLSLKLIPHWFNYIPVFKNTRNYFIKGTFDLFDIVAIIIGSMLAYLLLFTIQRRKDS